MTLLFFCAGLAALVLAALLMLRLWDWHADREQWLRLTALQPVAPARYDPAMVAGLPEPARRFLNFAIAPGTPLLTVAEIHMGGEFSLGSRSKPDYQPMNARQILAAPTGFVWQLRLPRMISGSDYGSDTGSWTRFRAFGLLPLARLGGDLNHARAAYGRYIAEAAFWTPAALLPGPGIVWAALDRDTARVTVTRKALSQAVDIRVDAAGRPIVVQFMRWSDANPEKRHQLQPFGGYPSDFREVHGFRIPFQVEAGNLFGTDEYFPFFKARLTAVRFPLSGP